MAPTRTAAKDHVAAAMAAGMFATGAIFLSIVGLKTWDQVTIQYPTQL